MNKTIIGIIVGILLAVGGGVLYLSMQEKPMEFSESTATTEQTVNPQPAGTSQSTSPASPGQYVDYSPSVIADTKGTKVLFFYAPWCPQCRALEADIKKTGLPENVTVIKVDYDTNQELKKKYGVTMQTTLVKVDDQGQLVKKYVSYDSPTVKSLEANIL